MKLQGKLALLLALLVLAVSVVMVAAHAELIDAQPAPGAELAEAPAEIRLTFSEAVDPRSEILLFAEGFQAVGDIETQHDASDPAVIFASLPALEHGAYTVQWTALSDDGHEISGTYSFGVGAEAETAEHVASDDHAEHAATESASPVWSYMALALIGGALLLILAQRFLQGP